MGKGGGSPPPQPSSVTQTTIPEYAKPYVERMLGQAEALTGQPYKPYGGERIAGPSQEQLAARENIAGLQAPGQYQTATELGTQAGLGALAAGQYQPGQFATQQISSPALTQYQMGPAQQVSAQQVGTPQMATAQTGYDPRLQQYQMGPAQQVSAQGVNARDIQAAQTGFAPELQQYQMAAPGVFSTEKLQQYMSPYMQEVVDVSKRRAIEDAQKAQLAQNLGAARQGTYGGARQLLATTEREKALGQQLGDIQARGLQAAFEQAGTQYERDRAAQMTAEQQNLAAKLGVQQLGTTTGLQTALANLDKDQQARVQSEANRLQAQGMTQDAALRAALANQQAGLTTEQQNLAAQLQTQQLGTQTGLQTALANLSSEQQANVQNLAAQLQTQGLNAEQAMRAALANQQAGLTVGQANLQALLGTQQLGSQQAMQAGLANQQQFLEAQRLAEQSRQFGSNIGLQGAQAATQAAQTLGQLGGAQQQSAVDLARAQEAYGGLSQAEQQAAYDQAYQDFIRQQQYPYAQLGYMSDILRGSANLASTGSRALYETPPSPGAQLMGLASSLGGAYLAGGRRFAEGGEVKGLDGVKKYAAGGDVIDNMIDVAKLTPEQIEDTRETGARRDVPDYVLLGQLQAKLEQIENAKTQGLPDSTVAEEIRAKAMQEVGSGIDSIPLADNYYRSDEEVAQLAGGGIIAFANGGGMGGTFDGFEDTAAGTEPIRPYTGEFPEELIGKIGLPQVKDIQAGKYGQTKEEILSRLGMAPAATAKKEPPKPAPPKPEPKVEEPQAAFSDKTAKKVANAEDAYEKSLRAELDKTNMSEDDKLQALGVALMKFGAKAMKAKKGREGEAYGEGIEAAADSYVNRLNQAAKDRRQLTKDVAEYGLAKEKLRIAERGVEETAATRRETAAQTAALRMQTIISKAKSDYDSIYGQLGSIKRFKDKDNKQINPDWKTFSEYLAEQGIDLGGGPAPAAASGERVPIRSFRG